ncbi:hypothetical protein K3495_g11727 [Podosphaera aphanis]|nr:hypothetical protein K3495_g11727 [Podosphaera aphanis]
MRSEFFAAVVILIASASGRVSNHDVAARGVVSVRALAKRDDGDYNCGGAEGALFTKGYVMQLKERACTKLTPRPDLEATYYPRLTNRIPFLAVNKDYYQYPLLSAKYHQGSQF